MSIRNNDKKTVVKSALNIDDIHYYDVKKDPFEVYGLYDYKRQASFKRMPDDVAAVVSENVKELALNTARGRVRFSTDSKYISINVVMPEVYKSPHMTLAGTAGFDIYIDGKGKSTYHATFMPPIDMEKGYESVVYFPDNKQRSVTINFPLYCKVDALYIGLQEKSSVNKGIEYRSSKPVLYYGSSITQGGGASRPGNAYQSIISRRLNIDYLNLGFSGSAIAQESIAEYMAILDSSIFICDYDYNAPDYKYLQKTHNRLYQICRTKNAAVPIVFISKPNFELDVKDSVMRRDVIYKTFIEAVKNGDKNVYFIDGMCLFKDQHRDCCTVDGIHPNDAGFVRMAEVIGQMIENII